MARSGLVSISVGYPMPLQIILKNTQSVDTPSPFQQMLQLEASEINSVLPKSTPQVASDFHNIRFKYNYNYIPAWLESISNGVATIWVKLPVSIPANSSITIDMEVDPLLNFDGNYWGEAPQLSPIYGEYDDGASVFNNYWNFAGTSLPSGWGGSGYTINNGVTIGSAGGDYVATTSSAYGLNANYILDYYGTFPNNPNDQNAWFGYTTYNGYTNFVAFDENTYYNASDPIYPYSQISGTGQLPIVGALPAPQTGVFSVYFASTTSGGYFFNYASRGNYSSYPTVQLSIGGYNHGGQIAIGPFSWVRIRAYPPNGVMPTVEVIA